MSWMTSSEASGVVAPLVPAEGTGSVPDIGVPPLGSEDLGEVVPLEAIQVRGVEGEVAWTLRLDGGDVSGTQDLVVNVVVQPADVVVMPEPATRRVVRDSYGQISAVVAEP